MSGGAHDEAEALPSSAGVGSSPSFSVVIETANVRPGDPLLDSCVASIAAQGPTIHEAREVVLLVSGSTDLGTVQRLAAVLPSLRSYEARTGSYGALKASAAAATNGDVVVFADSDCTYDSGWLDALLAPFADPAVVGVTGETGIRVRGAYSLAVAVTFNFPGMSRDEDPAPSERYWANNVALRREALTDLARLSQLELKRGACVLHARVLRAQGRALVRQPRARSRHTTIPPREFPGRYFELGRDHAVLSSLIRSDGDPLGRVPAFPPDRDGDGGATKVVRRLGRLVAERPARAVLVPFALPVIGLAATFHAAGRIAGTPVAGNVGD